jgi:CubicO group peptidase (beta-lactamase class C family)
MVGLKKVLGNSVVVLCFIQVVACGSASDEPDVPVISADLLLTEKVAELDSFLSDLNAQERFNGAVLLAKAGEALMMNTYGYTDATKNSLLTTDSSFRLASVSKQFTTMAIMILKDRGLLDFSDIVSEHLPELDYNDITIEHLMHHTSGIQDYTFFPESYITEQGSTLMTMPVYFEIIEDHPLIREFDPGVMFKYSNTGYILLAEIVARVSGLTFADYIHQEISLPLGMNDTDVFNLNSDPDDGRLPYRTIGINGGQNVSMTYLDGIAGDGAVFSSIADFLKWDQALTNNQLISEETKMQAFTTGVLNDGSNTEYGYGWFVSDTESNVSHSGGWLAARTFISRNLTTGSLMVILDNSGTEEMGNIVKKITMTFEDDGF